MEMEKVIDSVEACWLFLMGQMEAGYWFSDENSCVLVYVSSWHIDSLYIVSTGI